MASTPWSKSSPTARSTARQSTSHVVKPSTEFVWDALARHNKLVSPWRAQHVRQAPVPGEDKPSRRAWMPSQQSDTTYMKKHAALREVTHQQHRAQHTHTRYRLR